MPWFIRICQISPYVYTAGDSDSYVPWLIHMCHDLFICGMPHPYVPWLILTCHDSSICAMTLWYMWHAICAMTLSYMGHDSFVNADGRRHTCSDLKAYVSWLIGSEVPWLITICHVSFICAMTLPYVPWPFHVCGMTYSYMTHMYVGTRSKTSVDMWMIRAYMPWLIRTCAMTYPYMCHDSFIYDINVCAGGQINAQGPHFKCDVTHFKFATTHSYTYVRVDGRR